MDFSELFPLKQKLEKIVLECIDPKENHYKFYHLSVKDNGFLAQWGRIGSRPQSKLYPVSTHNETRIRNEMFLQAEKKIIKGYKLKTYQLKGDHSIEYESFLEWLQKEGEIDLFDDDEQIF